MEKLWELPGPSTSLTRSPRFEVRLRREVAIALTYEDEQSGGDVPLTLVFDGTEAYRCTYHNAIGQAALGAYDCLVDLGHSPWLREIEDNLAFHRDDHHGLKHLVIMFDGGPFYEFICRRFRVEE